MAPYIRIIIRYGVGALFSMEVGEMLAGDTDVVDAVTAGATIAVGLATEWWYARARKSGDT